MLSNMEEQEVFHARRAIQLAWFILAAVLLAVPVIYVLYAPSPSWQGMTRLAIILTIAVAASVAEVVGQRRRHARANARFKSARWMEEVLKSLLGQVGIELSTIPKGWKLISYPRTKLEEGAAIPLVPWYAIIPEEKAKPEIQIPVFTGWCDSDHLVDFLHALFDAVPESKVWDERQVWYSLSEFFRRDNSLSG